MQLWTYRARAQRVISANQILLQVDLGFETYRRVKVNVTRAPVPETEEEWAQAREALTALVHKGAGAWPLQVRVTNGDLYQAELFYYDTKESALVNINDQLAED